MLTYEQNVKAVLECIFAGYKDELIEDACRRICALSRSEIPNTCGDAISRQAVLDEIDRRFDLAKPFKQLIESMPSVTPQQRTGRCKDCKYFEYDSVAKVDGIPLIVAHEICKRWGDGCKSKEDGYCFLFEPKMQEVQDE